MIEEQLFYDIEKKMGKVASWAVWDKAGDKPKSNISNMELLDISSTPSTLKVLQTNVVMVALNFAREVEMNEPFLNFHDSNPHGQDYKIRFAFEGTEYYGAYMTDIIKDFPMLSSKDVLEYLKENPDKLQNQINEFKRELEYIGAQKPKILAFGKDAFNILNKHLNNEYYSELIALTHYSHQISKENYRIDTHEKLGIKYKA